MKQLPEKFILINHEGLTRVTIQLETLQSIDTLLTRLGQEKMVTLKNVAAHPYGTLHLAAWTSDPPRHTAILELSRGKMPLATLYHAYTEKTETGEQPYVSPIFSRIGESFPLRCGFDFEVWAASGLRAFLSLPNGGKPVRFWVFYQGQVYKVPFGNIYNNSCELCLGSHNEFQPYLDRQLPASELLTKLLLFLGNSTWNADAFNNSDINILKSLVRFDSTKEDLPMLPPLNPAEIQKATVATDQHIITITNALV